MLVVQAARASERQPEPLAVQPALLALRAQRLLLVDYLGKAAAVVAVVTLALAVQVVQEVEALVAAAVVQHAVHTLLALVA